MSVRAVVFAYHNVGVRCLKVLLAQGIEVALVVTHEDNANENVWFESVADVCREHGIPTITPTDSKSTDLLAAVQTAQPDFIFSFYYRMMLPSAVLAVAKRGAYNMHGSLLPKYRGRAPINWAVLHGETETGASLHQMADKPDAGVILAQTAVPILPDDTAHEVFGKVVVAAEQTLWNVLPALLAGHPPQLPNILAHGSYFGGRKPEDGRIDWNQPAQVIYNLHRAVAPPYPGAFTEINGQKLVIGRARMAPASFHAAPNQKPGLAVVDNRVFGIGADGHALVIHELLQGDVPVSAQQLQQLLALQ
ncbi:MAG: formyltransferase [Herbaspirillum sp.]